MKRIALIALVAACGKGEEKKPVAEKPTAADAKAAADPACAAKAEELEPWIAQLDKEESTHEVDFVYELVAVDRGAEKVEQRIDNVFVTPTQIEAFDETESNRADTKLGKNPAQKAVAERLATIHGMGQGDRIRIDVDKAATWGDVARTVDAAVAAGYREALFAFTATSKLEPPAGVESRTTSMEVFDQAGARLDELGKTCPGISEYADAARIAAALVECHCAVDVEEIRRLAWIQSRWGQARPRTSATVTLGGDGAAEIAQPKATPWSEAHARLLELAAEGAPPPAVRLVAR